MSGERGVLVVKGAAGLGNRILALATAILYARISGRRLLVDWRDRIYANPGTNAYPHLFRSDAADAFDGEAPLKGSTTPPVWQDRLALTFPELIQLHFGGRDLDPRTWQRVSIDPAYLDLPEQIAVYFSYFARIDRMRRAFRGLWQALRGESADAILARILKQDLEPVPEITERVAAFRRERFGERSIGVHVRFTDKRSRIGALRRRLERAMRRDPGATIFLATDSERVSSLFRSAYRNVVETPKWLPPGGGPVHLARDRSDRLEGAREALVDLLLLASCDHLVGDGRSAFVYVARLWGGFPMDRFDDVNPARFIPPAMRHRLWLAIRYGREWLSDTLRDQTRRARPAQ